MAQTPKNKYDENKETDHYDIAGTAILFEDVGMHCHDSSRLSHGTKVRESSKISVVGTLAVEGRAIHHPIEAL